MRSRGTFRSTRQKGSSSISSAAGEPSADAAGAGNVLAAA